MSVRSKYGNGQGSAGNWNEGTSHTSELVGDSQVGSTENGPRDQSHLWFCVGAQANSHCSLTMHNQCKTLLWSSGFTQIQFLKYHHIPDIEHQRDGYTGQTHQL